MTRADALQELRSLAVDYEQPTKIDPESAHIRAEKILLALIADAEISEAFENIKKWYA